MGLGALKMRDDRTVYDAARIGHPIRDAYTLGLRDDLGIDASHAARFRTCIDYVVGTTGLGLPRLMDL